MTDDVNIAATYIFNWWSHWHFEFLFDRDGTNSEHFSTANKIHIFGMYL